MSWGPGSELATSVPFPSRPSDFHFSHPFLASGMFHLPCFSYESQLSTETPKMPQLLLLPQSLPASSRPPWAISPLNWIPCTTHTTTHLALDYSHAFALFSLPSCVSFRGRNCLGVNFPPVSPDTASRGRDLGQTAKYLKVNIAF